ncbi:hypothetical protein LINPERHAP2_LOCUS38213 [Linum perenne]
MIFSWLGSLRQMITNVQRSMGRGRCLTTTS